MKIGLLSDTHGDPVRAARAARALLQRGCTVLCHCGDIGSERVLTELAATCAHKHVPVHAVLGNVDLYDPEVEGFPLDTGVRVWGRVADLEIEGKRIAVIHGDDGRLLHATVQRQAFDYVFTGHTHVAADRREGRTRVINPGAVYRAHPPSVAVLNTATDELDVISLV